ncbi:hypothetical protein MT325_m146L [Paramecium bursaria chlorella virus MT325]|uniref:Uncharacterized protein m146L n=1 Tax=Paramecium bursaria Chlorella virus MT325 TaxID=346932 RepID=A7ITM6_PBCVM|nr:hypothetical protein MT325_m146L [Paramecium bursaria chlorella virus MT325]
MYLTWCQRGQTGHLLRYGRRNKSMASKLWWIILTESSSSVVSPGTTQITKFSRLCGIRSQQMTEQSCHNCVLTSGA